MGSSLLGVAYCFYGSIMTTKSQKISMGNCERNDRKLKEDGAEDFHSSSRNIEKGSVSTEGACGRRSADTNRVREREIHSPAEHCVEKSLVGLRQPKEKVEAMRKDLEEMPPGNQ